jgi:nucleoside-diphosphate-sugar epimerase
VTGGSGKLGRAVVAALIEQEWTVVNFDGCHSPDTRARFIRTEFTDYGRVVEAFCGTDEVHSVGAVVHDAAIPGRRSRPTSRPSTTTCSRPSTSSKGPRGC